jgi:hypothetical protein
MRAIIAKVPAHFGMGVEVNPNAAGTPRKK